MTQPDLSERDVIYRLKRENSRYVIERVETSIVGRFETREEARQHMVDASREGRQA